MTIYNIQVTVVELVDADSPEHAYRRVAEALTRHGFEPYYGFRDDDIASAFESEDLDGPLLPLP